MIPIAYFFRRLEGLKPPTGTDWKGHGRGWIYIYTYNHKNGR
jgi:hypothetical protein